MNSTKLTLIVLAAAAVMFSGCSTDNRVLGPGSDFQSEASINTLNLPLSDSDDSAPEQERFLITAKVKRVDVEAGCWFLQASDGNNYTPLTPEDLVLKAGMELQAEGYVDENIQVFCGKGPVFVIEKYKIIDGGESGESEDSDSRNSIREKVASDDGAGFNMLEGVVDISAAGCILLETAAKEEFVLQHDTDVHLKKGDKVSVTGYLSALPSFTCYEAPVFYAETIKVSSSTEGSEESGKESDDSASAATDEDDANDRFENPSDNSRSQDEYNQDEQDYQKKLEEEKRRRDSGNDRP